MSVSHVSSSEPSMVKLRYYILNPALVTVLYSWKTNLYPPKLHRISHKSETNNVTRYYQHGRWGHSALRAIMSQYTSSFATGMQAYILQKLQLTVTVLSPRTSRDGEQRQIWCYESLMASSAITNFPESIWSGSCMAKLLQLSQSAEPS